MKDLAPAIYRQRLVIEGFPQEILTSKHIKRYLLGLSSALNMKTLLQPVTHRSDKYGWAGWIHWESSGAHFYAWEQPVLFFSVDIYTCKAFENDQALIFTKSFFNIKKLVYKVF